jgi:enhancer of mRNA-decapping protein 4
MQRFIWCMYISDPDETIKNIEEDASKVFVITSNRQVDIYHLDLIEQDHHIKDQPVHSDSLSRGHLRIEESESSILTAAFSPDGLAISIACSNGEVKFFKISFSDNSKPTCVQIWKPHDSKAVTSLFFLDDHKNPSPNAQVWRYILTGCDYNSEIKLWCCEDWKCLQTIRFISDDDDVTPCLKATIDLSSKFLVMSDINRKVLATNLNDFTLLKSP